MPQLSHADSGLVYPGSQGADEAAVRHALRQHDPTLHLIPPGVDLAGRPQPERVGYRVAALVGENLRFVCFWGNDMGEPYPLSHNLVELVKQLDKNSRAAYLDENVRNELSKQQRQKSWDDDTAAAADDWKFPHGRPVLHRSQALRMSRDKRRAKGDNV